jgi:hypothetical protein
MQKRSIRCDVCNHETKIKIKLTTEIGLCKGCIDLCNEILKEEGIEYTDVFQKPEVLSKRKAFATCGGCRKTDLEQSRLICFGQIKGARCFVCNQCVGRLTKALQEAISGVFLKNP